jgi:hypothetical protein
MTDETPDTGSVALDLLFATGSIITVAVMSAGVHSLLERLRQKDRKEEMDR